MRSSTFLLTALLVLLSVSNAAAQTKGMEIKDNGGNPLFRINDDASIVAYGTLGVGSMPDTLIGTYPETRTRLMWHPGKAAFRAGMGGMGWNEPWVGVYSVAMGRYAVASDVASVAIGDIAEAAGPRSIAMGHNVTANATASIAMGSEAQADGMYSMAVGNGTTAQAAHSFVLGRYNTVAGNPDYWVRADPLLVVGNGTSRNVRSNAFTLLKNGNLTIAGTLTENSDQRLKTDIRPLRNALAGLARLQPVRYRFREGTNRPEGRQIGLIAQEVEAVFPELVSRGADGYLSLSYAKLSAVLVQALHEQQAEIETLKARLARLEAALPADAGR